MIEDTKFLGVAATATVFSCSCNCALCLIYLPFSATPLPVNSKDVSLVIDKTTFVVPEGATITSPSFNSWENLVLIPVCVASLPLPVNVPVNINWLSVVTVSAAKTAAFESFDAWEICLTLSVE